MCSQRTHAHSHDAEGGTFPGVEESVTIDGPSGELESLTLCPSDGPRSDAIGVICHPHPLYGGTMHNKVVHYIAKTLNELGLRTVRFNFRGVGASEGTYGDGDGEVQDLQAVLDWVRQRHAGAEIWLAGFSFGAYVALREGCAEGVTRLITVAPPVNLFDFEAFEAPSCPWLLLQGEGDEVVPYRDVRRWVGRLNRPPEFVPLPGVDHFFHGKLNVLHDVLMERLASSVRHSA
ncbi:MAG: alpha/beta fold hydrolase [Gammaproteobacteria bacterium]